MHVQTTGDRQEKTIGGLHVFLEHLALKITNPEENKRALDVGCGSGAWLERLYAKTKWELNGIDIFPPEPPSTRFRFIEQDLNSNCNLEDNIGRFDLVKCIEVIEHVENLGLLLDLLESLLAPSDILLLTTPNVEGLRARLRFFVTGWLPNFDQKGDPTHLFPLIEDTFRKMLKRRRMVIDTVYQYPEDPRKTLMYKSQINTLSQLLWRFLPDKKFGDICIYVIRKR